MNLKVVEKPIALVLDTGLNGYGVIRSLGRRGIPVIGIDSNPRQIGLFSKYCEKKVSPNIEKSEEKFIDFLLDLGEQMNTKGVLFPTSDVSVLAISRHRGKLEHYYEFPMSELNVIEKLVNKKKFYKLLDELDIPHPKTYFPIDASEVKSISKESVYPCFIKPVYSTQFAEEFRIKGFEANSSEELIRAYDRAFTTGHEVVIQEVIPGDDTNLHLVGAYFNHASEVIGIFTFRRIRQYPHMYGNGALCAGVWIPEIAELCTSFLKKIEYHGIIDAEFKKDPRDNKFKLIEINARTGWQNRLATRCGVDLPYMAYRDAIGEDIEKVISKKEGIKWLYMLNDVRSSFESISKGELRVRDWLNSLRGEKEYAIFAWDDPIPFFVSLINISSAVLRRLLRKK